MKNMSIGSNINWRCIYCIERVLFPAILDVSSTCNDGKARDIARIKAADKKKHI
jgi:hypothetical protein